MKSFTSSLELTVKMNNVKYAFQVRKEELEKITRKSALMAIMVEANIPSKFIDANDTKAIMIDEILYRQFGKQFANLKFRLAIALRAEARAQALAAKAEQEKKAAKVKTVKAPKAVKEVKAPRAAKVTTVPEGYSYELATDGKFYLKHEGEKIGKSAKGWFATSEAKAVEWLNKIASGKVTV